MRNFYPLCKSFKVLSASLTLILLLASLYCPAQELFYADKPEDVQKRLSSLSDPGRSLENGQVYIKSFYEKAETGLRKSFRIKVAEGGSYHLAVHVLSTRNVPLTETEAGKLYPLQKITVYVDGQDVGLLALEKEGWHATVLQSGKKLTLAAGEHLIWFETDAPYYPEIDVIKLASSKEDATLNTSEYSRYIQSLIANMEKNKGNTTKMEYDQPKPNGSSANARTSSASNGTSSWEVSPYPLPNPSGNYKHMMNVPVVYTYYRKISLTSGQNVTFHTTPIAGQDYYTVDPVMYLFCEANKNHAWSNDDHTGHHPRIQITVPQSGDYYLVLRAYSGWYASTSGGSQGVVDVWQNGSSLNTSVPVSGYMVDVSTSESGTLNYFTGYSTGVPKLWVAESGLLSPLRFH